MRASRPHHAFFLTLAALAACTLAGCQREPAAPRASTIARASAPAARTQQQAMAALMALPELKAWSDQLEKSSGGQVHGALVEDDPKPKLVGGKSYWQLTFVENGSDAARRWESFLVAEDGSDILVEDFAGDRTLTLQQWRTQKHPMQRTGPEQAQ